MKKGFTLIELLGIIIIIGIIAVITIPSISKQLEDSKKNIAKTSVQNYQKAINEFILREALKKNTIELNGEYNLTDEGNLYTSHEYTSYEEYDIQFDGKKPKNGTLTFNNNNIIDGCITIDKYKVEIDSEGIYNVEKGVCEYDSLPTRGLLLPMFASRYREAIEDSEITESGLYNVTALNNQIEYDGELPTAGWVSIVYDSTNGIRTWKYSIKYKNNEVISYNGTYYTTDTQLKSEPAIILIAGTDGKTEGDEIAIGTEHFYVLENTGTKIITIAKANLNVGENKNNNLTEGMQGEVGTKYGVTFSEIVFWTQSSSPYIKQEYRDSSHSGYAYVYDQTNYAGDPGTNTYSVAYYVKNYIDDLNTQYPSLNLTGRILTRWEYKTYSENHNTILSTQLSWLCTALVENASSSNLYNQYLNQAGYNSSQGVRPVIEIDPSKI